MDRNVLTSVDLYGSVSLLNISTAYAPINIHNTCITSSCVIPSYCAK